MTQIRGYSIAFARDMDREKIKPYSASLPPIYEQYDGRYLAVGGADRGVEWLTGDWGNRMIMLAEFQSPSAVHDFWWGPEYRRSAELRRGAVTVDAALVAGTEHAPDPAHSCFLLAIVSGHRAWRPPVRAGTLLVACDSDQVIELEGNMRNLSITVVGFADRDQLDACWADHGTAIPSGTARVCAADRAPG